MALPDEAAVPAKLVFRIAPMPIPANVEALLKKCDTGTAALTYLNANKIDIETSNEGAIAYFDPGDATHKKKIVLNVSKPAAIVAAYFCHEINHYKMNLTGKSGDALKEDKDAYVAKMVSEEAAGTGLGFRCFYELESKGETTGVKAPDRYDFYKRAVESGKKEKGERDASSSDADRQAAGFAKGAQISRALINERFLGPNALQSYEEYYSGDWARQRKKQANK